MTNDYQSHRYATKPKRSQWWPFLKNTWWAKILFVNAVLFIVATLKSGSLFLTEPAVLWQLGAQDPVTLAGGEYWRYVTPMFLHGGLIHFLFNSMAIYYVGRDLEPVLGKTRFLLVYFFSGIAGSVASALFSLSQSVGASGAIFGLIGAGLYIERSVARYLEKQTGEKPARGPYMLMLLINLPLSFLPMIDSNAHLGGFFSGFLLTWVLMHFTESRLVEKKPLPALALLVLLLGALTYGAYLGTNADFVAQQLEKKGDSASETQVKFFHYNRALKIKSDKPNLYFKRGRLLILAGELAEGYADIVRARKDPAFGTQMQALIEELIANGHEKDALYLQDILDQGTSI